MPDDALLSQILSKLDALTTTQATLTERVESLTRTGAGVPTISQPNRLRRYPTAVSVSALTASGHRTPIEQPKDKALYPNRVICHLPDQTGIKPIPLKWAADTPTARGPIVCYVCIQYQVAQCIGAHSGPTRFIPPVEIPPQASWFDPKKIVSFDPWGHVVQVYANEIASGLDVRPSIAITKLWHIKLSEIDAALTTPTALLSTVNRYQISPLLNPDGTQSDADPGIELACSKAAVEPVWWLPGVAERFGIHESLLRRALFEETGGMYPELITRPDIKVFLPPIVGNPAHMRDPTKELTLRVHDECNGSDVFGSDICTCKPYLVFAIEECVRTAQKGGVGIVVYFRKEGRALGEVTKYLVYNLRKRGGDSADKYFKSTELIAGVKDMRFQALMPDILHWLGITKIDNMISMSDMKYNAIVDSGIPILKRYDLPEHLIPPDSRVEIDAKIASGYFTSGKKVTEADLYKTVGRTWEETDH
ncbi:GTP cyclohydrolase N terminal [Rhizoctonia solani]|uniref:GTP cyclohydrolase N terminal n=1 Tax=Rhizoctonia solani TaxID=456999 RepID=A0A8H7IIM0_9AGAM|nr:GTP cyclohydrolase N terminal [Rhizoctonia solani]